MINSLFLLKLLPKNGCQGRGLEGKKTRYPIRMKISRLLLASFYRRKLTSTFVFIRPSKKAMFVISKSMRGNNSAA